MIFYFSGTGNSRWIACELARRLGDRALDIIDSAAVRAAADLSGEQRVGFVFPIYAWGVPEPMEAFAERAAIPGEAFTFGVCTYGAEAGRAMRKIARKVPLDSTYGIAMPNNYVIGSELEPPETVRAKIAAAGVEIDRIAGDVAGRVRADRVSEGAAALLKSTFATWGFNRFARATKPFAATDACVGCGRCAAGCPSRAIELADGVPRWVKDSCYQCLRCINECPVRAIEYGEATRGRARYSIERYLGAAADPGTDARGGN